jgi:hypothetical protein
VKLPLAPKLQTTRAAVQQRITRARQMLLKGVVPLFGALMLSSKPSEAFSAAVMRALRAERAPGQPRRAVAAKGKLLSWLLSVGAAVVLLGALPKGIGLVRRWSGHASTAAMTAPLPRSQGPAA